MKDSRHRRLLTALGVATIGVMGLTAGVQASTEPAASGRLVGPQATSAQIRLIAWPNDHYMRSVRAGDNVKTIEVGRGRADAAGRFVVVVDRRKLTPKYRQADGSANLQLLAGTGHGFGSWSFSLPGAGQARMALPDLRLVRWAGSRAGGSGGDVGPNATGCAWTLLDTYDAMSTIGESWPYGQDTSWMSSQDQHSLTTGIAISSTGANNSWSVGGTSSTTTGVTFTWAASIAYRVYKVELRYGDYRQNGNCVGHNIYETRPMYPTGGYGTGGAGSVPSWTHCTSVSAGTWTRDSTSGSSYTKSGGVDIAGFIGINLSLTTSYSSSRTLNYRFTVTRHVCGSDDVPSMAAKIQTKA